MVALLAFPAQGTHGEGSGVISADAVARTEKGKEPAWEGTVRESENAGAFFH